MLINEKFQKQIQVSKLKKNIPQMTIMKLQSEF